MLYLATLHAKEEGKKPLILAGRNAHKSFISAAALIDFELEWIYPEKSSSYLSAKVDKEWLKERLASKKAKPTALYITSPDYLGNVEDIRELSKICHENGVLLLVDNAHGAYLKFLSPSRHPIDLGADICCDSAHKTLHALTGSAYLHISKGLPKSFPERAKAAMSLFASTSPSYLILASLDKLNERLFNYKAQLSGFLPKLDNLRERLSRLGFEFLGNEPLKLCISAKKYGYLGVEMAKYLARRNVYSEFYDKDFLVLMLSPDNTDESLEKLYKALAELERKTEIREAAPQFFAPVCKISPREAVFSPYERVKACDSLGRILAEPSVFCPPAVPILVPGELIDEKALSVFEYYGITTLPVLKEV
jgi:arginine/lysine/ornithine decarboxylase